MTPGIGFHELRQACEISALREDLERLVQETGALRDEVEAAVEQVRARFAALGSDELTDASVMASLLQFAVTTLLDIREQARRINTRTGPVADDDRPSWLGAADAPRVRPVPPPRDPADAGPGPAVTPPSRPVLVPDPPVAEPVSRPAAAHEPPSPPRAPSPSKPLSPKPLSQRATAGTVPATPADSLLSRDPPLVRRPVEPVPSAPSSFPAAAPWLTSSDTPPPPSRASTIRSAPPAAPSPGGIDWLGPAGR